MSSLVKMGMEQAVAEALASEPIYRRQNEILASVCRDLNLPLADTTQTLVQAEAGGIPQYWTFDTHPRPIALLQRSLVTFTTFWRQSVDDNEVRASGFKRW